MYLGVMTVFQFDRCFEHKLSNVFKAPRPLTNSESCFPAPCQPHHVMEVARGFLCYSSPVAHITSCHAKESKQGSGGGA